MSPTPAQSELPCEVPDGADRRLHRRYPVALEVKYKLSRGRATRLGNGTTLNVSSRGVLFTTDDSLPTGSPVELTLNWPFLLEGVCPLKLVMRGRVVRSDWRGVAVRTRDHEFRVAGIRPSRVEEPGERRSA
jgi:hypothetical protein